MNASITLLPDTLLKDRYRVIRCIGGGGFSQVFEVADGETEKVLKILDLSAFRHPQVRQKAIALFEREAKFLSQFRHPGVPLVESDDYFVWRLDEQTPLHCLVMEKIPGIDLQAWSHQNNPQVLSPAQAIAWLRQLVDVLAHLHQCQFFHRDIKPANIMLKPDGQLVLIDFGAVREITETYLRKQQGQETGTAIVSAGYTPPEQAEGQAVPQSDFFALGRTFVYLFTGEDPLHLPKDLQTGQLLWRDRVPEVPQPLADLIDHLMAPFPGQRPQTCEAIVQVLDQVERTLSVERWSPLRNWLLSGKSAQRNRLSRSPKDLHWFERLNPRFGLVGLMLLGGITVWSQSPDISLHFNDRGVAATDAGNYESAQWFYRLALLFNSNNPATHFNQGDLYEISQQLGQARAAYQSAIQKGSVEAYNNLARLDILNEQYNSAISLLQMGLQKAETRRDRYAMLKNLGWAQLELKQYGEADQNLRAAIALDPSQAAAHCLMAQVYEARAESSNAAGAWEQCLQYADSNNPDEQIWMAHARSTLKSLDASP